jgi:hypothetical protein
VVLPFGGGVAFDLGALLPPDGRLLRIQVKSGRVRDGCIRFNTYSTDHGSGAQTYHGRADVIAVFVPDLSAVFVIPVGECPRSEGYLRLEDAKNNQRRRIRLAADYTLDAWLARVHRRGAHDAFDASRDHLRHHHAEGSQAAPA